MCSGSGGNGAKSGRPDWYYQYRLRGVVIHSGTLRSGHYYSFIQERKEDGSGGRWYELNDSIVRAFDPQHIAAECFAGTENYEGGLRDRVRSAYILYYDRVCPPPPPSVVRAEPAPVAKAAVPTRLLDAVIKDSIAYWRDRAMFEVAHTDFMGRLFLAVGPRPIATTNGKVVAVDGNAATIPFDEDRREGVKVCVTFLFNTLLRSKHKESLINQWFHRLKRLCDADRDADLPRWILEQLLRPRLLPNAVKTASTWLRDLLLVAPDIDVRIINPTRDQVADLVLESLARLPLPPPARRSATNFLRPSRPAHHSPRSCRRHQHYHSPRSCRRHQHYHSPRSCRRHNQSHSRPSCGRHYPSRRFCRPHYHSRSRSRPSCGRHYLCRPFCGRHYPGRHFCGRHG